MLDYTTALAAICATSLTPAALAWMLGVTPVRVRQMIRSGSIYATRLDGRHPAAHRQGSPHRLHGTLLKMRR